MAIDIEALRAKALAKMGRAHETTPAPTVKSAPEVKEALLEEKPPEKAIQVASLATPLSAAEQISQRIADLQEALQKASPQYESLLHHIHVELHRNEDVVHLLTEEQIGIIVSGLAKKKNIVISKSASKGSSTPTGKKIKSLTLEDLI